MYSWGEMERRPGRYRWEGREQNTQIERERIESKTIDFGEEKNRERERERRVQRDTSLFCVGQRGEKTRVRKSSAYNETKGFLDGRGGVRNG